MISLEEAKEIDRRALIPIEELKKELSDLESGSFTLMTDEELRERVRQIHNGFRIQAPILPAETLIFRAVRVSCRPTRVENVGYPPAEYVCRNGRLNRSGEVIFYGSLNQFASCLQECSWGIGEFFAVSAWLTTEPITFSHLGYSSAVLEAAKARRELPFFAKLDEDEERNALIREWQARVFTQSVRAGEEHLYRLPIALKDLALSRMMQSDPNAPSIFSGVIYPSIAMWLLGDNVAILPSEVDKKLALFEVLLLTLDAVKETVTEDGSKTTAMEMKTYDFARANEAGDLIWGQQSQVVYPPGTDASKFKPSVLLPGALEQLGPKRRTLFYGDSLNSWSYRQSKNPFAKVPDVVEAGNS